MGAAESTPAKTERQAGPSITAKVSMDVDVQHVVQIAQAGGRAIMDIYEGEKSNWGVDMKSDGSPLTKADQAANKIICDALFHVYPHIPIVSEENKQIAYETRKSYQYSWCVDPLDGTKEFIKRNGQFTVNIALLKGGEPVMGVVYTPVAGKTHYAVKGKGAYMREGDGPDLLISCAEYGDKDAGLTIVGSASHSSKETEDFIKRYKEPKFEALGSSLKFMLVAEGKAHVYPRLAPTCEWDTAASQIIVEEAGGVVLQAGLCSNKGVALEDWKSALAKGKPVVYNKESNLNPFFVVFGKRKAKQEGGQ